MTGAELVLVRHAESIWNAEQRWQGQTDVPLSDRGRSEAARVAERLAREPFDRAFVSDLARAKDTADAIARSRHDAGLTTTFEVRPALREMDLGAWCGLPHAEVLARFPEELAALARGDDLPMGGHGESLPRFEERTNGAIAEILAAAPGARVLVVTHGGVIRAILTRLLALRGHRRPLEGVGNTSLTRLRVERGELRALLTYNDAGHLELHTRGHDGAPSAHEEEREMHVGEAGRRHTRELLSLAEDLLVAPAPDAVTELAPGARRLIRYAVAPPVDAAARDAGQTGGASERAE